MPRSPLRSPPALAPGARIAAVAPSSPFEVDAFHRGVARLRERFDVVYDPGLLSRKGYLAGDDARRLAELKQAIEDPSVDAIIAARGGYGATRILAGLDPAAVAARPRLLVGFSDVTALHALWARAGVRSIHGPMVAALGRAPDAQVQRALAALQGALPDPPGNLKPIASGRATGPLLGGNLAVLCALLGTPHMPDLTDAILFLEDTGERPYRVDRMLTSLREAGVLSTVAGVTLGAFTECAPGADGVTVDEVLAERLGDLGVPVVAGVPAGHVDDNLPLPFGSPVELKDGRLLWGHDPPL